MAAFKFTAGSAFVLAAALFSVPALAAGTTVSVSTTRPPVDLQPDTLTTDEGNPLYYSTSTGNFDLDPDLQNAIDAYTDASGQLNDFDAAHPGISTADGITKNARKMSYQGDEPVRGDYGSDADFDAAHEAWVNRGTDYDAYLALQDTADDASKALKAEYTANPPKPAELTQGATCSDQLDNLALGLSTAGMGTDVAGAIAEGITSPAAIVGAEIAANVAQAVGFGLQFGGLVVQGIQNSLPNCDAEFTGTVQTYANFVSHMGVNTFDGALNLGYTDPVGNTQYYYNGITLGGGALAGAGNGGSAAQTDDKDAIAIGNGAYAKNANDLALGTGAQATGGGATAIGWGASASGLNSVVVGHSSAGGENGIAIGTDNNTGTGLNNTAIGTSITITGAGNTVLGVNHAVAGNNNFVAGDPVEMVGNDNSISGDNNYVSGDGNQVLGNDNGDLGAVAGTVQGDESGIRGNSNSVIGSHNTIGSGIDNSGPLTYGEFNQVFGDNNAIIDTINSPNPQRDALSNSLIGNNNAANGDSNFIAGNGSSAVGNRNIAIGEGAKVNLGGLTAVEQALALGANASVAQTGGVSIGANATSSGDRSIAIGKDTTSTQERSTAFGVDTHATAQHATALGSGSTASGSDSLASGYIAQATASGATAVGSLTQAFKANASAFGDGAQANGAMSTAIGQTAVASADYSSAFGQNSRAFGSQSTAVGVNAFTNTFSNAAAFGYGATALRNNQQVFGTTSNTYTMPGITSWQSTSNQQGQLGLVTTDGDGDLASDPALYNQIGKNRQGVAMAMAMSGFWVPENKSMAANFNVGTWDGAWAVAANIGGKINDNFHVSGAVSVSETGLIGGRAGGQISW